MTVDRILAFDMRDEKTIQMRLEWVLNKS